MISAESFRPGIERKNEMLIAIFGESCTGKSTLAEKLATKKNATIYTGKDYLRLAKNEAIARKLFQKKLSEAITGENIIYVIAEKGHLDLLPEGCVRILVTADLDTIKDRFAMHMRGTLPPPVVPCWNETTVCSTLCPMIIM